MHDRLQALECEIAFMVDGRRSIIRPRTFAQIPSWAAHAFKNETRSAARMLIPCSPSGFEKFIADFAPELASHDARELLPSPVGIEKLLRVAPDYRRVMLP